MSLKEPPIVNLFQSLRDYEEFIYTLKQNYPVIQRSTLVVIRLGQRSAFLEGELAFAQGYRLTMQEQLSFDADSIVIDYYGYELWHNIDKFAWYDPQPHPENAVLASTFSHHKHVPPDIKHHRIPAPGISFTQPNLPTLIQEIQSLIEQNLAG